MSHDTIPAAAVADILRGALTRRRITQEELALEAEAGGGGNAKAASRWIRSVLAGGRTTVDVATADRVLTALDLPLPAASGDGGRGWCPTCRDQVATMRDGRCAWCDTQTGAGTTSPPPRKRSHAGVPFLMGSDVLDDARRLYVEDGMSMRRVAAALHHRTGYATVRSFAQSLYDQFERRGWMRRDRVAAAKAASYRHGLAGRDGDRAAYKRLLRSRKSAPCSAVTAKGRPCGNRAAAGEEFCAAHRPDRSAEIRARLADFRDRWERTGDPCRAVVENGPRTGEPCRGRAIPGIGYCAAHRHHATHELEAAA